MFAEPGVMVDYTLKFDSGPEYTFRRISPTIIVLSSIMSNSSTICSKKRSLLATGVVFVL